MKNGVIVIMSLEALKENTSSVVFFYTTILTILTRLLRLGDSYSRNK